MKHIFLSTSFILLLCVVSYGQNYTHYPAKLSLEQREYRDYALGVLATEDNIIKIKGEPIFDRLLFQSEYIIGQVKFKNHFYDSDVVTVSYDEIWVCFDKSMHLRFVFPCGTQDVSYSDEDGVFYYTNWCTVSHDFWYNIGVIDIDGNVLCKAVVNGDVSIDGDLMIYSFEGDQTGGSNVHPVTFVISSLSKKEILAEMKIQVPHSTWEEIKKSYDSREYESEDKCYEAFKSLYKIHKTDDAEIMYNQLQNSGDIEVAGCAKNNLREIRKAKRHMAHNNQLASKQ